MPARGERGVVLLIVLFLAAVMLIGATVAVERLVTMGRRQQEDELVWRGEQYVRAIRLYYRKYGQFPRSIEDFSKNPGNLHFLRKVYKDPMNGADGSWRYVYMGPSGQLLGSLTRMMPIGVVPLGIPQQAIGGPALGQPAGSSGSSFGSSGFGSSSFGSGSSGSAGTGTSAPGPSGTAAGTSGTNPPVQTGGASGTQIAPGNTALQPPYPEASPASGLPADFGNPEGLSQAGGGGVQPPKKAIENAQTIDSPVFGGQLVGIGSKVDRKSIRFYKGYGKYREWEFLWDPAQEAAAAGGLPTGTGVLPPGIGGVLPTGGPAPGTQPPGNPPPTGTPPQPPL